MNSYSAHPSHYFFSVLICFFGELALHNQWTIFGWSMYALGALSAYIISSALYAEINNIRNDAVTYEEDEEPREAHTEPVHVTVSDGKGNMKFIDLPATPNQLEILASGLLQRGKSLSQREWSGSGKPFSRNDFNELINIMIARGLAKMINESAPQQGYTLTPIGTLVMQKYIPHSPADADLLPITGSV